MYSSINIQCLNKMSYGILEKQFLNYYIFGISIHHLQASLI
jgi:hypothetical protein